MAERGTRAATTTPSKPTKPSKATKATKATASAARRAGAGGGDAGGSLRDQRRAEKDRVSRNHILDAAEKVFGQKGFHAATLKEVADQAEFSVVAVSVKKKGKDDLFAQVLDRQGNALLTSMQEATAGLGSPRAQLHAVVDASLAYFRERPDFYRLFQRELGGATWALRASLNEVGYARYREVMTFEESIVAAGVVAGELRDGDPEILAALFSGMVQAYIAQWVFGLDPEGASRVDEAYPVERFHDMVDRAFGA